MWTGASSPSRIATCRRWWLTAAFAKTLWYRLAVFPVRIPPLRECQDDIADLAGHFARRAVARLGLPLRLPSQSDLTLLRAYPWPGNVRELATVIERAALLGSGNRLECAAALGMAAHIRTALERTQGRIEGARGAARLLAINPHTLRARMRKLGVDAAQHRQRDE
jgi:DNA-binding NtrC family response regulator